MANEELKPCPFCGSADIRNNSNTGDIFYANQCNACGARLGGSSHAEADEKWNRRTPAPLKRWTAEDGAPPDGVYISGISVMDKIVVIGDNEAKWYGVFVSHKIASYIPIAEVYGRFDVLYGPIEAEGKIDKRSCCERVVILEYLCGLRSVTGLGEKAEMIEKCESYQPRLPEQTGPFSCRFEGCNDAGHITCSCLEAEGCDA